MMHNFDSVKIAIIGLGYVGLPVAVEFAKHFPVVGFDINSKRIEELELDIDRTGEVSPEKLKLATQLSFSCNKEDIAQANVYIVTVPTPIDNSNQPDLTPLKKASSLVGELLSVGDTVIFESTVYPGATEEDCIPIIENISELVFNQDFYAGYSPERINPGDKTHTIATIKKVTSGSTPEAAEFIDRLYSLIISAGTHKASSIRVAEAAKVIENTQRDINIALINELSIIFNKLGINTLDVLEAAGTKWNFLPFRPGLVGGHCIGVDPYYLTHKAESIGYHPEMILAGRRINDGMSYYVVSQLIKHMIKKSIDFNKARVLIMGLSFKENCPDMRNTKVIDIFYELTEFGIGVDIHDPRVDHTEAEEEYNIDLIDLPQESNYDAIILAVAHNEFKELGFKSIKKLLQPKGLIYDLKNIFTDEGVDIRL